MANIRIIAVGSGGNNSLSAILSKKWKDIDCIAAHTDKQSLDRSEAEFKILLGKETTHGLGAGSNPVIGRKAALESRDGIRSALNGSELVVILAGLGGGTGTGGAPVVAEIAGEVGAKVIAIVSLPFTFEGTMRRGAAEAGLRELREKVDSVIMIHNERILAQIGGRDAPVLEAFTGVDCLMSLVVGCIMGAFSSFGLVAGDVANIRNMLLTSEVAGLGFGFAAGDKRAAVALKNAMASHHLEGRTVSSACGILIGISGPADVRLSEVQDVLHVTRDAACMNSRIACVAVIDEKLADTVWITIVYTAGIQRKQI